MATFCNKSVRGNWEYLFCIQRQIKCSIKTIGMCNINMRPQTFEWRLWVILYEFNWNYFLNQHFFGLFIDVGHSNRDVVGHSNGLDTDFSFPLLKPSNETSLRKTTKNTFRLHHRKQHDLIHNLLQFQQFRISLDFSEINLSNQYICEKDTLQLVV